MRVLVTGSTGLLGTNLVHSLLAQGYEVRALARDPRKASTILPPEVEVVVGDIASPERFPALVAGCDAVIHAAAYFREYFGRGNHAADLRRLNVEATVYLARAAQEAGVKSFVFVSSSGTIGRNPSGVSDETTAPGPRTFANLYFRSKLDAEAALREESLPGLRLVTVLPGWMFGPNDSGPTSAGALVKELLDRGKLQMVGGIVTIADARDVADGIVRALERGRHGERYALAGHPIDVIEALSAVRDAIGRGKVQRVPVRLALLLSALLEPVTRWSGRPNPIPREGVLTLSEGEAISSAKAELELGVRFRPFAETARDTVAYFQLRREGSDPMSKVNASDRRSALGAGRSSQGT